MLAMGEFEGRDEQAPGADPVPRGRPGPYSSSELDPDESGGRHAAAAQSWAAEGSPVLESAGDDAKAIVNDALEQAALVIANAEQTAEAMLAQAREDAEREVANGKPAAGVLREQADAIVA